jgi:hypothetical protein
VESLSAESSHKSVVCDEARNEVQHVPE